MIFVGQQLKISNEIGSTYVVQPGDNLFKISRQYNVSIDQLKYANGLVGDIIYSGQSLKNTNW